MASEKVLSYFRIPVATARGVCNLAWQLTWPLRADLNLHGLGRDFPWHTTWRLKLRGGARWNGVHAISSSADLQGRHGPRFSHGPPGEAEFVIFVDFHTKSVIFS